MATKLINQQNGETAFFLASIPDAIRFGSLNRENHYAILLLQSGCLEMTIDLSAHRILARSLVCLSPYQPHQYLASTDLQGWVLCFHPDFFCTHKHQHEIALEGSLFHNPYELSFFSIADDNTLRSILQHIRVELTGQGLAQHELLVSYLKIYLIQVLRLKADYDQTTVVPTPNLLPAIQLIKDSIERDYRHKHSPADYANLVHMSPRAVGKIVKKHFNKTLSDLIAHRIIVEAKRELYLTSKSVKEIAYSLGYSDEYYFSRFFKKQVGTSPQLYRNTVGFARAES